ncbi:MAG TPA: NADH-quinone oxidoreductase subunit L [Rectinemataceae bacterium]|nr:NADH-quinone oxidoreductase subunit L [Rectinemataceae bacterium]
MITLAILLTIAPIAAYVVIVALTNRWKALSAGIAIAATGASLAISLYLLWSMIGNPTPVHDAVQWLSIPRIGGFRGLEIVAGILVDPLSALMASIVSLVAFLVMVYSVGYMKGDEGFSRYFAYLSLFTFSMLGLVVSDNYFMTFVFWELVGLSSYLLIGFWRLKDAPAEASKKAFVTNRWGDFGFMVGIILLYLTFGTFDFTGLATMIPQYQHLGFLTLIAVLVFTGPMGKSAQFPFHVWLPDAMEGPTPVSALIHAATMVAAGVYLVARAFVLFHAVPNVMELIAWIGGFTAIFAALIALVQKDIKRILAYSTLSQLGYMFLALGSGSMSAGMFHLTTHAFFKALLFLGAGSVIHALEQQDIFKMGGLAKKMPITTWTFVIGALSLGGLFPLAGFWSKDEILLTALKGGQIGLYWIGVITAFLTAFYMFRLIFTAFFGKPAESHEGHGHEHHAHESPASMTVPLIVLAVLSVVGGLVGSPWWTQWFGGSFGSFIYFGEPEAAHVDLAVAIPATIVALLGIGLAWVVYGAKIVKHEWLAEKLKPLHSLLEHKFYVDEVYGFVFKWVMLLLGRILDWIDHKVIDGTFDGLGSATRASGGKLRLIQSGKLQSYALVIFGAVALVVILLSTNLIGGFVK